MFAKTLVIFAAAAFTAEAVKIKSGLSANALVGVNVRSLSKAELSSLLKATADDFSHFCHDHDKHYLSQAENEARQTNWLEQEAYIQTHNSRSDSKATFGHNQFSDMSEAEKAKSSGTRPPANVDSQVLAQVGDVSVSVNITVHGDDGSDYNQDFNNNDNDYNYDYDNNGDDGYDNNDDYNNDPQPQPDPSPSQCDPSASEFVWGDSVVAPIKNQGSCGSCYAFSANTVLESAYAIKYGTWVQPLSEQQVVDCEDKYSDCYGCGGGWPYSLHTSTRDAPLVLEQDYEYTGYAGACQYPAYSSSYVSANNVEYIAQGNDYAMKEAICRGPITTTVKASGAFMSYSSGVMTSYDCPYNMDLDHAVAAVGWKTIDGQQVLVVRNSWGTGWGEQGNIYLAMDGGNDGYGACGVLHYPSTADVM